jgi:hypothetical protein
MLSPDFSKSNNFSWPVVLFSEAHICVSAEVHFLWRGGPVGEQHDGSHLWVRWLGQDAVVSAGMLTQHQPRARRDLQPNPIDPNRHAPVVAHPDRRALTPDVGPPRTTRCRAQHRAFLPPRFERWRSSRRRAIALWRRRVAVHPVALLAGPHAVQRSLLPDDAAEARLEAESARRRTLYFRGKPAVVCGNC